MQSESRKVNDSFKLFEWFEEQPGVTAILTDRQLLEVFQHPVDHPQKLPHLLAELLTRCWLYEERCPAPMRQQLNRSKFSAVFNAAFQQCKLELRRPLADSEPRYEASLRTPQALDNLEKLIWECLRR